MNTEYGLDKIMMTNTDSPRLAVTTGEWCASNILTTMRTDLRQMNGIPEVIGGMYDCRTVWGFPQIDSTVVDCGVVELDDLTFRRTSFPPDELSAASAHSISDWVTSLRISPQTCMQLFLLDNSRPSLVRECGCATRSSLSNDGRPKYA